MRRIGMLSAYSDYGNVYEKPCDVYENPRKTTREESPEELQKIQEQT